MTNPLSKFIYFAVNDCEYAGTRYELIVSWVHLMFLKTKASKHDASNWKNTMNGPLEKISGQKPAMRLEVLKLWMPVKLWAKLMTSILLIQF